MSASGRFAYFGGKARTERPERSGTVHQAETKQNMLRVPTAFLMAEKVADYLGEVRYCSDRCRRQKSRQRPS